MNIKLCLAFIASFLLLTACGSKQKVIQTADDIEVSREAPGKNCVEISKVRGSSISARASREEVLESMKTEAANKGANYVVIQQFSDNGTAVTGVAYQCK